MDEILGIAIGFGVIGIFAYMFWTSFGIPGIIIGIAFLLFWWAKLGY